MVEATGGIEEARGNVIRLQIRIVRKNLLMRFTGSQQLQHIDHADAHAANARAPPALLGVDRDALEERGGAGDVGHPSIRSAGEASLEKDRQVGRPVPSRQPGRQTVRHLKAARRRTVPTAISVAI